MLSTSWRRTARPSNVTSPLDVCKFEVTRHQLPFSWTVDLERIDALDGILTRAQLADRNVPSPCDLGAVVKDVDGVHLWDGWSSNHARDVCLLARE